ncbi:hypothetical protein GGX14DRAFT_392887 [Mycena pura]|uniref:Uncharacterized protein n=1 Tax=Mycena pura TaxID=153505 RepID=A0AAD6YIU6_9AGAR|nr:hypothetical protein GGX14DRAFT_392887 [Mycena pura]
MTPPRTSENTDPNNSCRPGGPDNNASLSKMLTAVHRRATSRRRPPAPARSRECAECAASGTTVQPRATVLASPWIRPAEKCVRRQGLRDPKVSRHAARAVECFTGASWYQYSPLIVRRLTFTLRFVSVCRPERIGLARAGYELYRAGSQRGLDGFRQHVSEQGEGQKRARDDEGEGEPEEEEVMQGDDRHKRRLTFIEFPRDWLSTAGLRIKFAESWRRFRSNTPRTNPAEHAIHRVKLCEKESVNFAGYLRLSLAFGGDFALNLREIAARKSQGARTTVSVIRIWHHIDPKPLVSDKHTPK